MNKPIHILKFLLDTYFKVNGKVSYINNGGCGAFAEQLYIVLQKLGFKPEIVVLTNNKNGIKQYTKNPNGVEYDINNDAIVQHVVVKVNGIYMDSLDIYKTVKDIAVRHKYTKDYTKTIVVPLEIMSLWNKDSDLWYYKFNRRSIKTFVRILNEAYVKTQNKFAY